MDITEYPIDWHGQPATLHVIRRTSGGFAPQALLASNGSVLHVTVDDISPNVITWRFLGRDNAVFSFRDHETVAS